jgi:hypothetical protein
MSRDSPKKEIIFCGRRAVLKLGHSPEQNPCCCRVAPCLLIHHFVCRMS